MIFGAFQGCASLWSTTHSDHYPVQSIAEVQTFSLISCQLSPTLILFKPLLITWYRVSSNPAALVVKTSLANIVWESGTIVLFAAGFLVVCKLSLQDLLFDWLIDWLIVWFFDWLFKNFQMCVSIFTQDRNQLITWCNIGYIFRRSKIPLYHNMIKSSDHLYKWRLLGAPVGGCKVGVMMHIQVINVSLLTYFALASWAVGTSASLGFLMPYSIICNIFWVSFLIKGTNSSLAIDLGFIHLSVTFC